MIRWMSVLLSLLQCVWINHCYLYTGTPFRHYIHWTIPHSTTTTITTTTNSHAILAAQRDNVLTVSQKFYHHQHSRSTYLCMQSRRSPQLPTRPTAPSAYLLPTPPVNSIGNFFDQSTLVPSSSSSSSSSSDDSGSDSSGGGMSFIQCHMIAVGEIEGNEGLYQST